ncbi:hypothetical protein AVEN_92731-1 [Araneus ventricosus]|uniref:Peptidase A2 domain-containing protein n=1 Tax=Araneus ventricosus TaxID=182803 RepID=A0A4Y2IDJ6_ARAVE|nr:hypothetical protein AVEN_92731-1 [Araneus ventricosus]
MPKSVLTCREGNETGHKIINCVAKETNHASEESLSVRLVGENSDESNSFLKKAKINNFDNVQALIDTGSSCCLLKISVAQKLKLKFERAFNKIYGFGNQKMPALSSIGRIKADIEVDSVKAENISIYVVPDDAQSVDLIIGRTWLDVPHIAYTKIGERVHIGYREDELFRNFPIDEKVNPVCLERLEIAQSESESLQIKDTSQQKIMGNLADDLKMVKNELRLLQGDIKNLKEERQSLLLQIQKKNKNIDNLKSINNSLVKTNSYYVKKQVRLLDWFLKFFLCASTSCPSKPITKNHKDSSSEDMKWCYIYLEITYKTSECCVTTRYTSIQSYYQNPTDVLGAVHS